MSEIRRKLKKLLCLIQNRKLHRQYKDWIWEKTRPYCTSILLLLSLDMLTALLSMGVTLVNKQVIDHATGSLPYIDQWRIVLIAIITLLSMGISAISGIIGTWVHEKYAMGIRSNLYENLMRCVWDRLSPYHSGDLVTRLTGDVDAVAGGISGLMTGFIYLAFRLVLSFCILFYYDHWLAIFAVVLGPLGVLASLLYGDKLHGLQTELRENQSRYTGFLQESLTNVSVAKAFELEGQFRQRLEDLRKKQLQLMLKRNIMSTVIRLSVNGIFSMGYLAAFAWSIYRLATGSITYGTMSVFLALVSQIQGPVLSLANMVPQFINTIASVKRLMELDQLPKEEDGEAGDLVGAVGVKFDGISFSYDETVPVLKLADLTLRPGEMTAIIGESGSGKTTAVKLILSLLKPRSGKIVFFNEEGDMALAGKGTRKYISYVPQGNTLISGSIRDNLILGRKDATDDEMWRALEIACAAQFLRERQEGLDSVLSERAGTISEGQAQRIAIARAIVRKAPILILDEATAALDMETERKIVENLHTYAHGLTCIVITHRTSLLHVCNNIYRLENGVFSDNLVKAKAMIEF